MGALRRRRPLASYENTSKIISPIVRDRRRPSAMTSQETKKFVSCDHRRSSPTATYLKNLWEMSKSCFFLNKQGNNQLKFDRNHELYVEPLRCALVGNFETHRLSSATITDV